MFENYQSEDVNEDIQIVIIKSLKNFSKLS
jgi:hypothetical protein